LLGSQWKLADVAAALLIDPQTAHSYFLKYKETGKKGLLQTNHHGKESFLTEQQEQELSAHLDEHLYLTSIEIIDYVQKQYRITYSLSGMKDLLKRLGFSYKKPKHVPGKMDREKQKAFIRKYRRLLKTKGKNDPIYFADACHPTHNSIPAYGWIRKGKEQELKANCGRNRVNINGAVDIKSCDIVTDFTDSVNGQSAIRLFEKLLAKNPLAEKIHIILDNARYYYSSVVKNWLKTKGKKIKLHFLPPYSPNLNVIERLWKFFKKKILYNKYYEKFEHFVSSCKNFFRYGKKYKAELRTCLTDNFHLFKNVQ
jgi:transposase